MKIKESRVRKRRMPTEVHQFVGLTSYYHRFTKNFSKIVKSLTAWTLTKTKSNLGTQARSCIPKNLKPMLYSILVLSLLERTKEFVKYHDTSHQGLGCILMQKDKIDVAAYYMSQKERVEPCRVRSLNNDCPFQHYCTYLRSSTWVSQRETHHEWSFAGKELVTQA